MKDGHRTFMPPSSACGPTHDYLIHDYLLVFQVACVAESHEEPDPGWSTAVNAVLEEDGSEDDISLSTNKNVGVANGFRSQFHYS